MFFKIFLLFYTVQQCRGVIYNLNDTAYELMPPLFSLDDYESCLLPPDGLYCVLQLELHAGDEHLISVIREYSEYTTKHFNHTYIDRAVCVTKSCKKHLSERTEDLEHALEACLNESISAEYGLQATVSRVFYCQTHGKNTKEITIDESDWAVAGIIGFVVLINVVGSLYDVILQRKQKNIKIKNEDKKIIEGNPYMLSFSVFQNWKWLVYKSQDPKLAWLHGLHGIRAIATFLMISAHVLIIYGAYIDNTHDFEKSYNATYFQMIVNGAVIIQLFFVMSGMLLVFKMLAFAQKTPLSWWMAPKILFFRWLRLTPANALAVAFASTWLRHTGSGPLWQLGVTDSVAGDCRATWWRHLLYYNNYNMGGRGKYCIAQTWYVAADMQLFVLGVLVLLATRSRGRWLALGLLVAAGVAAPAAHVYAEGLYGVAVLHPELYRALTGDTFHRLHILGHNNVAAFAVGMACGFFLNPSKTGETNKKLLHKKLLRWLSYASVPLGMLLVYLAGVLFLTDHTPPLWLRMGYQGLYRLLFSLIAATVGLALKFDRDGVLRKVVEWDGWIIPSRLSYCVFLLHMFFVYPQTGNKTQLGHVSFYNIIMTHVSVAAMSFAAALPLCMLVEAPMIAIIKLWSGSMVHKGHPEVNRDRAEVDPGLSEVNRGPSEDHGEVNSSRPEVNLKVTQFQSEDIFRRVKNEDERHL